jgi:hypothetical protein
MRLGDSMCVVCNPIVCFYTHTHLGYEAHALATRIFENKTG